METSDFKVMGYILVGFVVAASGYALYVAGSQ